MSFAPGFDIDTTCAKLAITDAESRAVWLDAERATTGPATASASLIARLGQRFDLEQIATAGVSGSEKSVIPPDRNWAQCSRFPLHATSGKILLSQRRGGCAAFAYGHPTSRSCAHGLHDLLRHWGNPVMKVCEDREASVMYL